MSGLGVAEKQTDKEIKGIKQQVRKRDRYRCRRCGRTQKESIEKWGRGLDVHRLLPGLPYSLDICVALCLFCHSNRGARSAHIRYYKGRAVLVEEEIDPIVVEAVAYFLNRKPRALKK